MEISSLKKAVEAIEMPEDMRQRILAGSLKRMEENMEEQYMKKVNNGYPRMAAVAAVLVLCICLPVAGMAAANTGFFRDIMRGTAVVGLEYLHATDEISVTAQAQNGTVEVMAAFKLPESAPYSVQEQLSLGGYEILDQSGIVVAEGEGSDAAVIIDGRAAICLPAAQLEPGTYTLRIYAFLGSKKADQDLPIKGNWECKFTVG